ncbi:MAG: hypothetical protein H7A25_09115 [Leptospiraceae bacterium]|nr:hypothetical protein [Leptospiraceae bacterium]MCP5500049.1 hypothetical protein [Leptospiraceae bacterium]
MADKKQPLLHEVLAVEQDLKGNSERARNQLVEMFRTKQSHFTGMKRTFRPFAVDEEKGESAGERLEAQTQLVTTVHEELEKTFSEISRAIDLSYQIDEANTLARADLIVKDELIAKEVPATFLLQLEKRLKEIRAVYREIPCFDPVRIWSIDPGADKKNVLRAEPVITIRKQKTRKYKVMVEATKEHPAQVDIVEVDEPVGEIRSYDWTGMLSLGQKAELLEQIDILIEAVKQARSRANEVAVNKEKKIAEGLVRFLLKPIKA